MTEALTGALPPPLPPRNRTAPHALIPTPPALPPRPPVAYALQTRRTISSSSSVEVSVVSANASKFDSSTPHTQSIQESNAINSNTPLRRTASANAILSDNATTSPRPSTAGNTQNGPKLPSLILSFILREPLERSHGRLSIVTAVESFFRSKLPAPPPFEYSTLVDHALLASQIALHNSHTRQQKRLPLVLSLSIGAFLVAATGIISRYIGWPLLAAATWFGPARFIMKEMWYIALGLVALNFIVDVFPMLSLFTLLWVGVICVTRGIDSSRNSRGEPTIAQFMQDTAKILQDGNDPKLIALDMVQNITEWWTYRQSEPERLRRSEEKAAKKALAEEKQLNKLRRAETLKEQKQVEIDQKAADKLRKLEAERAFKRMKEEKKAEKQRKKDEEIMLKRLEKEQMGIEKQRKNEKELSLKKTKLEEKKERAKELKKKELELKRVMMLKREKNLKDMEEKKLQSQEKEEEGIPEGALEEETPAGYACGCTPSQIEPKATIPSVGEITPSPPSSLEE